jgi:HK97 family phage major capsid protein
VVTAATSGLTAASPTEIAYADLVKLVHSVDPVYRLPGFRPGFQCHDSVLQAIHLLSDTNGQALLKGGPELGMPWSLLGFPLLTNLHMDSSIASGKKTVLFGAWSKYYIRDVKELRIKRLDERFADSDQTGFVAVLRSDSNLLDAGGHPLKYLTH